MLDRWLRNSESVKTPADKKSEVHYNEESIWDGKSHPERRKPPMCGVCQRIQQTIEGKNKYFVKELSTGYVVLGDYQRFPGYTLFLCKEHAEEIHFLKPDFRRKFLQEMSLVAEAAYRAFEPDKMNYELLGQGENAHMHWHFFPRRKGDTPRPGPVWQVWPEEMYDSRYLPSDEVLNEMKDKLSRELDALLEENPTC